MHIPETESITTVDLLRHGECEGGDILRGHTDVDLSEHGWESMQSAIDKQVNNAEWDYIISSPLSRCKKFSESLSETHKVKLLFEDGFRELTYGDWDGKERQFLWDNYKDQLDLLYSNPIKFSPPNGETIPVFQKRVLNAFDKLINQYKGKHLLLIQHGGTIRIVMSYLLSMPVSSMVKLNVPFACFTRFNIYHDNDSDKVTLMFHNSD